jgi:hypothetical protein
MLDTLLSEVDQEVERRNHEIVDFCVNYLFTPEDISVVVTVPQKKVCNYRKVKAKLAELGPGAQPTDRWSYWEGSDWHRRRALLKKLSYKSPCGKCVACELLSSSGGQGEPSRTS